MTVIPMALLVLSWILIVFGMVSLFRLKNLYTRFLSATIIDTISSLVVLFALMVISIVCHDEGPLYFCYRYLIRFLLLVGFLLITNPISAHVVIRSAFLTGVPIKRLEAEEKEAADNG